MKLAAQALATHPGTELMLLFACDNGQGNTERWSAWCVHRNQDGNHSLPFRPHGERAGVGDHLGLAADGSFTSIYHLLGDSKIAELIQYTNPKLAETEDDIELTFRHEHTGEQTMLRFPRRMVLTDQQMIAGETADWERLPFLKPSTGKGAP